MDFSEDLDQSIEEMLRKGWAAQGLSPEDLPPSHDRRMKGLVAIVRQSWQKAEAEIVRLRRLGREVELRLAELEERVRRLEEQVGLGHTLQ